MRLGRKEENSKYVRWIVICNSKYRWWIDGNREVVEKTIAFVWFMDTSGGFLRRKSPIITMILTSKSTTMNVTEEVTIHRPNVSTLLSSAFIRGDLNATTRGPFI